MPRDLFGDVTRPSISIGSRSGTRCRCRSSHIRSRSALLIALPILAPAVMPSVFANDDPTWIIDASLPPPPPPPPIRHECRSSRRKRSRSHRSQLRRDSRRKDRRLKPDGRTRPGPERRRSATSIETPSSLPPPPAAEAVPQKPVRVGGTIRAPQKIRDVQPVYPPMAQCGARAGHRHHRGHHRRRRARDRTRASCARLPLLDQAALEAVRQWEFTPTLLNGVPVPVVMTVTVAFTLK